MGYASAFPARRLARDHHQYGDTKTQYQDCEGHAPEEIGVALHRRLHQDEASITRHQECLDLLVGVAGGNMLAHQSAKISGKFRIGFVDGLALAHKTAQLLLQRPRAGLLLWIGKSSGNRCRVRGGRKKVTDKISARAAALIRLAPARQQSPAHAGAIC